MEKMFLTAFVFFVVSIMALYSQGLETSDCFLSQPVFSDNLPKLNAKAMLIEQPAEIIVFFREEGIELGELSGKTISNEILERILFICVNREDIFCALMHKIAKKYMNPQYSAYVVQVGNIFWTIYS